MSTSPHTFDLLKKAVAELEQWLFSFPQSEQTGDLEVHPEEAAEVLSRLSERLKGNYPFHSPAYAGQMLKPPHEIAWAAYALTMLINPNNHALDGGPPTSEMEKEIIPALAAMFGFPEPVLGHLSSSGTIANLEALWVARNLHPDKGIAFSSQSHYTHERMCDVLGMSSFRIPVLQDGNWDMEYLERVASSVGTMVVTMGTTGAGRVEPLHTLLPRARDLGIRVHLDAAYGGYFKLLEAKGSINAEPWSFTHEADSIVIDPHKHGLQPYGCGCVIFRDPSVGRFYKHDSPYTYFSSDALHLGEISLECSRAGAAAAALWATMQVFPLVTDGKMAAMLNDCRIAATAFADAADASEGFCSLYAPELDIVVYTAIPDTPQARATSLSALNKKVFTNGMDQPGSEVFVSLYTVPTEHVQNVLPGLVPDAPQTTVLRSVMMKPSQRYFIEELLHRLERARKA